MTELAETRLTKRVIDAIFPDSSRAFVVRDGRLEGLRLRVRTTGRKTFEYRYRFEGRDKLYVIGDYGTLTTDEALEFATILAGDVARGLDPQTRKSGQREEDKAALTFKEAVALYLAEGPREKPDKRESSWKLDRGNLERHAIPLLGSTLLRAITADDISEWQQAVMAGRTATTEKTRMRGLARVRGGRGAAARSTETLAAMLAWSVRRGLRADNPATRVRRLQLAGKERYLDEREAGAIWSAITALEKTDGISSQAANCFRLLALTGARRSEIVELKWREVDLSRGILLLPPLRHKSGGGSRSKAIPLPGAGAEILRHIEKRCAWVFPKADLSGPMEPPKRAWNRVVAHAGVRDASLHTLRHTLASWAVADGASLAIIGKLLGHTKPQTTERYAHLRLDAGTDVVEAVAKRYLLSREASLS